jgi:hypothetical protein
MELFNKNLIKPEEVKVLVGIDLGTLNDDSNPSNKAERLIYQAQSQLCAYITRNYKNDAIIWYHKRLNHDQREHFKMAIALQVLYLVQNGDIGNDSLAFDTSASVIKVNARKVSPNAIDELGFCGRLATNNIANRNSIQEFLDVELYGGY